MNEVLNDFHSELNASEAVGVVSLDSLQAICAGLAGSRQLGVPVAIAGGRYA
ncbi:MAG: hypothetical protein HGA21_06660, partial [Burkholderiaceae bacterium]|nr:hypothetical protein [Burkholderiaceae bacterium]